MRFALSLAFVVSCSLLLVACGGTTEATINASNEQSQGGPLEPSPELLAVCEACLAEPQPEMAPIDCLAEYGLEVRDCR